MVLIGPFGNIGGGLNEEGEKRKRVVMEVNSSEDAWFLHCWSFLAV